jgi:S1-C subfamily serine protease
MARIAGIGGAAVLLLVIAGLFSSEQAAANPQLYERCLSSVAFIVSPRDKNQSELGTGTLVNEHAQIVVTNYHVVGDEDTAAIFFPAYKGNDLITSPEWYIKNKEKQAVMGKVVARAKDRDLALIKLAKVPGGVHEMPLALRSPKVGETLHAVGSSGLATGALWRYSKGEVRQVFVRKFKCGAPPFEVNARVVETQIPINKGDSGGPVMNARGELIAVTQGFQDDTMQRLVSTSIDISEVRALLKKEKLLPTGKKIDSKG